MSIVLCFSFSYLVEIRAVAGSIVWTMHLYMPYERGGERGVQVFGSFHGRYSSKSLILFSFNTVRFHTLDPMRLHVCMCVRIAGSNRYFTSMSRIQSPFLKSSQNKSQIRDDQVSELLFWYTLILEVLGDASDDHDCRIERFAAEEVTRACDFGGFDYALVLPLFAESIRTLQSHTRSVTEGLMPN